MAVSQCIWAYSEEERGFGVPKCDVVVGDRGAKKLNVDISSEQ